MVSNFRIAWLLSYISIASFSAALITPALPQIQLYYGLQPGQVEWVVSAFLFGYVFGQLLYGPLANRWGRVFALRIGLTINLIGILLCLFSLPLNSFWLILIGRLVSALGNDEFYQYVICNNSRRSDGLFSWKPLAGLCGNSCRNMVINDYIFNH